MKLLDRLVDHIVDRVMARAKHNRTVVVRNSPDFSQGIVGGYHLPGVNETISTQIKRSA